MAPRSFAKILIKSVVISFFLLTSLNNYAAFIDEQLSYSRVKIAYDEKYESIVSSLKDLDLEVTGFEVLLKAYKYEQELVVYVRNKTEDKWKVYDTLSFCAFSGTLGPKVCEGDLQIPEGYYHINHFNPYSNFFLSLGVSYQNKADIKKRPSKHKGGAIYLHGNCVTIGCIPLTDEVIKELYILCALAKNYGQTSLGVHIFPFHLTAYKLEYALKQMPEHADFWTNLQTTERYFDSLHIQKKVTVTEVGDYRLNE
jgi:murein L,D-transpeptidase YafK